MPVLRIDAHFTVIESALKGYVKWKASTKLDSVKVSHNFQICPAMWPSPVNKLAGPADIGFGG